MPPPESRAAPRRASARTRAPSAAARLADRALVYDIATAVARDAAHALLGHDLLVLDVPVRTRAEQRLLEAIAARASDVLVTVPAGSTHHLLWADAEHVAVDERDA